MFGAGGRDFLDDLPLRPDPRARLGTLLRLIADFDREIDALAREIDGRAKHDPRVDVLCQIYGIGRYLGMLIVAEIGAIERFPSARHLCAWAGLTPTVRSSDSRARLGHISGLGSKALRWALVEAAQKACQAADRCATTSNASPNAAAARSPRSQSPARSSPSATTACATARSVASNRRAGRAR
jgi:transposase